jgi:hypothetical protein
LAIEFPETPAQGMPAMDRLGVTPRLIHGVMNDDFPADIKQFIADTIDSVAQLELLLLLRSEAGKQWTAEEAGKALYSAADVTALQMADLQQKRLLAPGTATGTFHYRPEPPDVARLVDRLADLYRQRRVAVITAVYTKPIDKIKSFADAFRLRKEK